MEGSIKGDETGWYVLLHFFFSSAPSEHEAVCATEYDQCTLNAYFATHSAMLSDSVEWIIAQKKCSGRRTLPCCQMLVRVTINSLNSFYQCNRNYAQARRIQDESAEKRRDGRRSRKILNETNKLSHHRKKFTVRNWHRVDFTKTLAVCENVCAYEMR